MVDILVMYFRDYTDVIISYFITSSLDFLARTITLHFKDNIRNDEVPVKAVCIRHQISKRWLVSHIFREHLILAKFISDLCTTK